MGSGTLKMTDMNALNLPSLTSFKTAITLSGVSVASVGDTSRSEDQPVINNRWMLNAFCNYCEDKLNTSFVVRCASNHVPAAQFVSTK